MTIKTYNSPNAYLQESLSFLEEKELENNFIIGICNSLIDMGTDSTQFNFSNIFEDGQIQISSIKTLTKVVVSGKTNNENYFKALADYYVNTKIDICAVVGESFFAQSFARYFPKKIGHTTTLLAHKLKKLNNLTLASGDLKLASLNDLEYLTLLIDLFESEADVTPKKDKEELIHLTKSLIAHKILYTWVVKDEIVSIASLIRKTKNYGIVGHVYTPIKYRGLGYATSCVSKISELILVNFSCCGLFTDQSNQTSNKIYNNIGYVITSEFKDIEFL
jgi:predicted GNAT family acetyltransferase